MSQVIDTSIQVESRAEFIVFSVDGPVKDQKMFRLQNPERLVIDVDSLEGAGVHLPANYSGHTIQTIRFGQFDQDTSRIVVELSGPIASAEIHRFTPGSKQQPGRFVVKVVPLANFSEGAERPEASTTNAPSITTPLLAQAGIPVPVFKPNRAGQPVKPHIIIDAGHGGKDPGALGEDGTLEKSLTLTYAQMLAKALEKTGRYRVSLTREDDRYVLLPDRVKIAREKKGQIFISIHADTAGSSKASGLSIYTVSETASDAEAAALAEQENSVDLLSGMEMGVEDKAVADILLDLTQRETKNKSSQLADGMVGAFQRQSIRLLPNTHRFAGFRVLKAPDIPSVLIEVGFLSNPQDERNLKSGEYQKKLANGVLAGLDHYFQETGAP